MTQILHAFDRAVRLPRRDRNRRSHRAQLRLNHNRRLIVHNTRSEAVSAERDSGARPTIRTNRVHAASADARPAHLGGQAQSCR